MSLGDSTPSPMPADLMLLAWLKLIEPVELSASCTVSTVGIGCCSVAYTVSWMELCLWMAAASQSKRCEERIVGARL